MNNENLIAKTESLTGKKVTDIIPVPGGDHLSTHQKITLSDGKIYLYKQIFLSEESLVTYQKMQALKIPFFQHTDHLWQEEGGRCGLLAEWMDGELLDRKLSAGDAKKAAKALRTVHEEYGSGETVMLSEAWIERFFTENATFTGEEGALLKAYALNNLPFLQNRPATVTHGDLHLGNILINGEDVRFIDLDECAYGDGYADLVYFANIHRTSEEAPVSYAFLNSYFDGKIPEDFWPVVNVYSIKKAILIRRFQMEHGKDPKETLPLRYLVEEHDELREDVPRWFREASELQATSEVPKAPESLESSEIQEP